MNKRSIFISIALATSAMLILICHFVFLPDKDSSLEILDSEWNVTINDTAYTDVDLKDLKYVMGQNIRKNDVLVMERTLNSLPSDSFPAFVFLSKYSAYQFFADGILISEKNMDKYLDGLFLGSSYNIITMPTTESSKIRIVLYIGEQNAYRTFEPPIYGNFNDVMDTLVYRNLFALCASIFLIVFGISFFIITMIFYRSLPNIVSQLFSSLLFIDSGIWILFFFRLGDLFIDTKGHGGEIEFLSLYLMIPLLYMIMGCIQENYKDWNFLVISITSTIICLFLIIMHFSGLAHMNRTLPYYQCITLVCYYIIGVLIVRDRKAKKLLPSEKIDLTGLAFFSISFVIYIGFMWSEQAGLLYFTLQSRKVLPLGSLMFVFTNLVNYFIYISESFARRSEYDSLAHLAYADGLTDLPNRSRYDKYLSDLDEGHEEYCIVSMDLNGLKEINDTRGHAAGDSYLLEFSAILKQCFDGKGFVARIGGDEFVAIMKKEHWSEVDSILTRLKDALEVKNVLYPGYRRSVAAGYAFSNEGENHDAHSVYLLADKRMYANKKLMHEKLGIAARI